MATDRHEPLINSSALIEARIESFGCPAAPALRLVAVRAAGLHIEAAIGVPLYPARGLRNFCNTDYELGYHHECFAINLYSLQ
jgi:hypothetical protein